MSKIIYKNKEYGIGGSNSVELTQSQYNSLVEAGQVKENVTYYITDADDINASEIVYEDTTVKNALDGLNNKFHTSKSNIDLNTITNMGFYSVSNSDSSVNLNYPIGTNGTLVVLQYSSTPGIRGRQIFFREGTLDSNDHQWYTRRFIKQDDVMSFGTWQRIISGKEFDSKQVQTKTIASATTDSGGFFNVGLSASNCVLVGATSSTDGVVIHTIDVKGAWHVRAYNATTSLALAGQKALTNLKLFYIPL